jgi:hypothetical protein
MTLQELIEYKDIQGAQAAADLLLLFGPDNFKGNFDQVMADLEKELAESLLVLR